MCKNLGNKFYYYYNSQNINRYQWTYFSNSTYCNLCKMHSDLIKLKDPTFLLDMVQPLIDENSPLRFCSYDDIKLC